MKLQSPIVPRALRPQGSGIGGSSLYKKYKIIVDLVIACTNIDSLKRPSMEEVVFSLENYVDIFQVMENKLHARHSVELKNAMVPQTNEWPAQPPGALPYHVLPMAMYSPQVKGCDGYIIEATLPKASTAPNPITIQFLDSSVPYYKNSMALKLHENYIGTSDNGENIIISMSSEGIFKKETNTYEFRTFLRLWDRTDRILITCDHPKDRLKVLKQHPIVSSFKLQLVKETKIIPELVEFELAHMESKRYKFGVVYCAPGKTTEDEMYATVSGSKEFNRFLHILGSQILLEGWDKYNGGLDIKNNSSGTQSVYTTLEDMEIMFHVSTMIPFDEKSTQQLQRKRHIGNDIVVLIFQQSGAEPFSPANWSSNFNHVFIIVEPFAVESENTRRLTTGKALPLSLDFGGLEEEDATPETNYRVSVVYKDSVKLHPRPFLIEPCIYTGDQTFSKFILTKLINCERAAMRSSSFEKRLHHIRQQLLTAICKNRKKLKKV